jgi:hypothetical protein
MMGNKKLSTIRAELRAAMAAETSSPFAALDRSIRKLTKNSESNGKPARSLVMLRNALAQIAEDEPRDRPRGSRTKRAKKVR